MTQLFDTTTYDASTDAAADTNPVRHLRSIPTDQAQVQAALAERRNDWRLDIETIEIGRRGIAMAREALQQAAKGQRRGRRAA